MIDRLMVRNRWNSTCIEYQRSFALFTYVIWFSIIEFDCIWKYSVYYKGNLIASCTVSTCAIITSIYHSKHSIFSPFRRPSQSIRTHKHFIDRWNTRNATFVFHTHVFGMFVNAHIMHVRTACAMVICVLALSPFHYFWVSSAHFFFQWSSSQSRHNPVCGYYQSHANSFIDITSNANYTICQRHFQSVTLEWIERETAKRTNVIGQ